MPSAVDGAVRANGQVWLLNPNGVLIGKGANINVGGLLATTSTTSPINDFLAAAITISPAAAIAARWSTMARSMPPKGGSVVLSAPSVTNNGLVEADSGHVVLGGTDTFTVDFSGDHLLSYAVGRR